MYNLPQKLLAEFVGTFALIFIGAGAICADQYLHASSTVVISLLAIAPRTAWPQPSWSPQSRTFPAAI